VEAASAEEAVAVAEAEAAEPASARGQVKNENRCDEDRRETSMNNDLTSFVNNANNTQIRDGIRICLDSNRLTGFNKKYAGLYNKLAPFYDFPYFIYNLISDNGESRVRLEYLNELEIKPGNLVLEVAIGTGANLRFLPGDARYVGLDVSWGMLKKCRNNLARWQRSADLFLGEAENLPFSDNAFDVVFHMGGINFFNDKTKAINEMVRVAKPGSKLLIVDETEKYAQRAFIDTPGLGKYFFTERAPVIPPTALVPGEMQEIEFKDIRGGRLYQLTFRKPG
jgi:ubiquinone/menaquinone biosynthesis C-methylase UbiE